MAELCKNCDAAAVFAPNFARIELVEQIVAAAEAVANAETALEKATASRGLLTVQPNELDLYGYVDELDDMRDAFLAGKDAFLNWEYGLEITKLVLAGYMSAERRKTIDLTDPAVQKELESYTPLIAQGKGAEVLM